MRREAHVRQENLTLSELVFIGLGLGSERSMPVVGLDMARKADLVFAEFYTSLMPGLDLANLQEMIGKSIMVLSRSDVEEHAEKKLLDQISGKNAVFLVPGDPMIATTHIDLRLRAEKAGIKTDVIPAASIFSAVCALTGLQAYKFGRTVTLPHVDSKSPPESPYEYIRANLEIGLHTLILLDLVAERKYYMTISEGLEYLSRIESNRKEGVIRDDAIFVGVARAGIEDAMVKTGAMNDLRRANFGGPPHCLIMPSKLHFMEAEALQVLTGATPEILRPHISR